MIENEENARLVNSFSTEDTYNQSEEEIIAIHEKEFINIEEFQVIFKRGKESQKKYRGRHKNPLPTFSSGGSGVDTIYNRLEAQKWMKRYL